MEQPPPPPGMPPPPPPGGYPPPGGHPPPGGYPQPPPGYYQPPQPPPGYYQPPPKPPIDKTKIRPRWFWLWIAGAIFMAGVAAAISLFVITLTSIDDFADDFQDFNAPGTIELRLDADEEKGIYARSRDTSSSDFDTSDSDDLPPGAEDVECTIEDVRRERRTTERADTSLSFNFTINDNRYDKLADFKAGEAGLYRVNCQDATNPANRVPLAIGPDVNIFGFVGSILLIFLIPGVTTMISVAILVVVLVMRSSSKKRLEREALPPQGYPPPA